VDAFLGWEAENHVEYVASERKIYSLAEKFAGTLDIIAMVNGRKCLVDLKTSNFCRKEYSLQTAAYASAWEEEHQGEKLEDRIILMLSKDKGQFSVVDLGVETVARDYAAFLACKQVLAWVETVKAGEDA